MPAIGMVGVAVAAVTAGAASLTDAADGWQGTLLLVARLGPGSRCAGGLTVPGWGDAAVLFCTVVTVILLGLAGWAMLAEAPWGQVCSVLAILPITILWLDAYAVSQAPAGDCDSLGLSGAAGDAILRAGWLFALSAVLCGVAAVLQHSQHEDTYTRTSP